jgi:capsular exopolysaccharide synthesis family protein
VAAYGIEFFDDTIKNEEDVSRIIDAPIIGHIPEMANEPNLYTFVAKNPRSPVADAYRLLRINLEFSSVDNPPKTIMVASTNTEEGKSTISTNLALIMAQAHRKVTLVDADFRRPNIHTALEISQYKGLSDIFRGTMTLWEAVTPLEDKLILVLPTGRIPPNPAELLGSERMDQILGSIKDVSDLVVIDSPPFIVPDASILASKVDGIILVVRSNYTRKAALKELREQLSRVGTPILGTVMNRMQRRPGYYSYSYYQAHDDVSEKKPEAAPQKSFPGLRRVKEIGKKFQGTGN